MAGDIGIFGSYLTGIPMLSGGVPTAGPRGGRMHPGGGPGVHIPRGEMLPAVRGATSPVPIQRGLDVGSRGLARMTLPMMSSNMGLYKMAGIAAGGIAAGALIGGPTGGAVAGGTLGGLAGYTAGLYYNMMGGAGRKLGKFGTFAGKMGRIRGGAIGAGVGAALGLIGGSMISSNKGFNSFGAMNRA